MKFKAHQAFADYNETIPHSHQPFFGAERLVWNNGESLQAFEEKHT